MDGDYVKANEDTVACDACGTPVRVGAIICPQCGASQPGAGADADENGDESGQYGDPIAKTIKDIQGWYKRNFTDEDENKD